MKVAILAGGLGTRLSEETNSIPKPMVSIGDMPILWHIMKIYSFYGFNDFVILGGYKSYIIKEYFANYYLHKSDVCFDIAENKIEILDSKRESWKITILDTGLNTMTGGRIKKAEKYLSDEPFFLTYGDGVGDIRVDKLLEVHKAHRKIATMTAVQPEGRFGALKIDELSDRIITFDEKPRGDGSWINGGFFVLQPEVFRYISNDQSESFEKQPLEKLAEDSQLFSFKHSGFWKPMDTLRDKNQLENLWNNGNAPWKIWT